MKFVGASLVLVFLVVSLQAGKVTWSENGSASIAGTAGEGCTQSAFATEDKNTTKPKCK